MHGYTREGFGALKQGGQGGFRPLQLYTQKLLECNKRAPILSQMAQRAGLSSAGYFLRMPVAVSRKSLRTLQWGVPIASH